MVNVFPPEDVSAIRVEAETVDRTRTSARSPVVGTLSMPGRSGEGEATEEQMEGT